MKSLVIGFTTLFLYTILIAFVIAAVFIVGVNVYYGKVENIPYGVGALAFGVMLWCIVAGFWFRLEQIYNAVKKPAR